MKFYSQYGQDRRLYQEIFHNKRKGFFVDVGAHDGRSLNNTLFFQENLDWTGINIEPNPMVFAQLEKNRPKCINERVAIGGKNGTCAFLCNTGYTEMLSGIIDSYDPRHRQRIQKELKEHGGKSTEIEVKMTRMDTLLEKHNVTHIDYLSIDVEGNEKQVLESIDFSKVTIDVIGFEVNFKDQMKELYSVLAPHGYKILTFCGCDLIAVAEDLVVPTKT